LAISSPDEFLVELSCGQTDRHTDRRTDADERFTPATVSNNNNNKAAEVECESLVNEIAAA